jgi:hypothetical protein
MKNTVAPAWLLALALLALSACKGSETDTAADASAADANGLRVLDAGERPRTELRYHYKDGATNTSTTTFKVASLATSGDKAAVTLLPGLRLDIVSGPASVTDRGVRVPVDVVKAEAVVPQGFDEAMAQELRDGAAVAENIGGWVELDDRGNMLEGELNEQTKRAGVPIRMVRMIVNTRETLTRVRLPEEKIGLGARWETHDEVVAYGFKVQQVNTYTFVDRAGDDVMLDVTVQQFAKPQTISFPEQGMEISVDTMTAQAEGQIILDLGALESDATATGTAEDKLYVKTVDGTETIEITERFEIQIANTSSM